MLVFVVKLSSVKWMCSVWVLFGRVSVWLGVGSWVNGMVCLLVVIVVMVSGVLSWLVFIGVLGLIMARLLRLLNISLFFGLVVVVWWL